MIRIENRRSKGGVPGFDAYPQEVDKWQALKSLAIYELGFGGFVWGVSPTKIVIKTHFLSDVDINTFTGPEDEMKLLVEFIACHLTLKKTIDGTTSKYLGFLDSHCPDHQGVIDGIVVLLDSFNTIGVALVMMFGDIADSQENIDLLCRVSGKSNSGLEVLIDVLEFVRELGTPLEETCVELSVLKAKEVAREGALAL
jgi:hypothetical protein